MLRLKADDLRVFDLAQLRAEERRDQLDVGQIALGERVRPLRVGVEDEREVALVDAEAGADRGAQADRDVTQAARIGIGAQVGPRAGATKLEIERSFFDVLGMIESLRDAYKARALRKGIGLYVRTTPSLGGGVHGDAIRLRQILDNLVSNAVKFTRTGQVTLIAQELETDGSRVHVRFAVEDTGPGIAPDAQERIFEAYSQEGTSATRRFGGAGLGLAIAKKLVELMGGRITLDSVPGRGSTFSFDLWLERDPAGRRLDAQATRLQGLHALVVSAGEDDAGTCEEIRARALSLGIRTDVEPPASALATLRFARDAGRPYDCVIIDAAHGSAAALVESIAAEPQLDNLRFVFLTTEDGRFPDALPGWRYRGIARSGLAGGLYGALTALCSPSAEARATSSDGGSARRLGFVPAYAERILVAEDNEVNRMLALAQLEELGFEADFVEDGAAAISAVETGMYALVFMDVQMPNVDGLEATAAIRKREAGTEKRVPIVAMTANASPNYRETCLRAGMDDYIAKPVLLADVQRLLNRWLLQAPA